MEKTLRENQPHVEKEIGLEAHPFSLTETQRHLSFTPVNQVYVSVWTSRLPPGNGKDVRAKPQHTETSNPRQTPHFHGLLIRIVQGSRPWRRLWT